MGSTTPPPSPYTPRPLTLLEFEEMMASSRRLRECDCALEEAEEAHSKMVEALAAQERADQRAESEKARAAEWQNTALAELKSAKKSSEEAHLVGKKARVAKLEQAIFASIRKANESQKCSDEAHSKMAAQEQSAKAELADEVRRREEKLQENLLSRDKMVDELEQAHSKMVGELGEARRREEKLQEIILSRDKRADELVEGCAHLWECWQDSEREVAKVVSEKEELKAKVEELSKALEEAMARETSRLEEEYDKVEYEECCKLDDEESDS